MDSALSVVGLSFVCACFGVTLQVLRSSKNYRAFAKARWLLTGALVTSIIGFCSIFPIIAAVGLTIVSALGLLAARMRDRFKTQLASIAGVVVTVLFAIMELVATNQYS